MLIVVCGVVLAVVWILLIASCSVGVLQSVSIMRFLKMMAPAMVFGIHPFVVSVVSCRLLVVVSVSSSSMYTITGEWSDLRSSSSSGSFETWALPFLCCGIRI